jgi:hypothetical protein
LTSVDDLDSTKLDDAMALLPLKPGSFRIEDDLSHVRP